MRRTEKEMLCSRLLLCHTKALAREHLLQGDWKSGCVPPTAPLSVSLPRSLLRSSSFLLSLCAFIWKLHQNHLFFQRSKGWSSASLSPSVGVHCSSLLYTTFIRWWLDCQLFFFLRAWSVILETWVQIAWLPREGEWIHEITKNGLEEYHDDPDRTIWLPH